MTIEEVIAIVDDQVGEKVSARSNLHDLGLDSLEFLDLLLKFPNIPDSVVAHINTVNDLCLAANGEL